jgi:hypothetical protein
MDMLFTIERALEELETVTLIHQKALNGSSAALSRDLLAGRKKLRFMVEAKNVWGWRHYSHNLHLLTGNRERQLLRRNECSSFFTARGT